MNILQVSSATERGGGESHVADLASELAARRHQVHLVVRSSSPLHEMVWHPGVVFHHAGLRNSLDLLSARRLSQWIRVWDIDVVHAHVARDYPVCAWACKWSRRPALVLTRHHYLPLKRNPVSTRALRRASRIIAVSESVRRGLLDRFDLPETKVVTIPNWVRAEEYRRLPDAVAARQALGVRAARAVGMAGQLSPAKGPQEFIQAAARVAQVDPNVEFLIVGTAKDGGRFARSLRNLVRDLGLGDRLGFRDSMPDLKPLYSALDVFVLPSWNEAFSLVLAEAMAAGLPVVAPNIGGPAEIVRDGITGMLFRPRDPDHLAEKISQLLSDEALRARLGQAAQQDVAKRFDRAAVLPRIEALYQEVCPSPPAESAAKDGDRVRT